MKHFLFSLLAMSVAVPAFASGVFSPSHLQLNQYTNLPIIRIDRCRRDSDEYKQCRETREACKKSNEDDFNIARNGLCSNKQLYGQQGWKNDTSCVADHRVFRNNGNDVCTRTWNNCVDKC